MKSYFTVIKTTTKKQVNKQKQKSGIKRDWLFHLRNQSWIRYCNLKTNQDSFFKMTLWNLKWIESIGWGKLGAVRNIWGQW